MSISGYHQHITQLPSIAYDENSIIRIDSISIHPFTDGFDPLLSVSSPSNGNLTPMMDLHPPTELPVLNNLLLAPADPKKVKLARRPRRNNSERSKKYRQKKKAYVARLMQEVETLQYEVLNLHNTKRLLCDEQRTFSSPFTIEDAAMRLIREYYDVFRHGLVERQLTDGRSITPAIQREFLASFMHPHVVSFGGLTGVDAIMEQWRRYTDLHINYFMEFRSAQFTMVDNCVLVTTTGVAHMRYSRRTIEHVYPHVVGNETLTQRLIGKEIHLPYTDQFRFNKRGKLKRYDLSADFVTALLEALGNLEDVAIMLGSALMEKGAIVVSKQTETRQFEVLSSSSEDKGRSEDAITKRGASSAMALEYILS